jgi:hypothetical protein
LNGFLGSSPYRQSVIAGSLNATRAERKERVMNEHPEDGLLVARRSIEAARTRSQQESDGGSTGVSDTND